MRCRDAARLSIKSGLSPVGVMILVQWRGVVDGHAVRGGPLAIGDCPTHYHQCCASQLEHAPYAEGSIPAAVKSSSADQAN